MTLVLLPESYPRELARILGGAVSGVQLAVRSLEKDGLIAGRSVGRTRLFRLDPRYFAAKELLAYLRRLADADSSVKKGASTLRRRPRRTGKPL